MSALHTIGIADMKIAAAPDRLITYALGSCVGVCMVDGAVQLGGLLHIMLPDSTASTDSSNIYKFADLGVPAMVRMLEARGASRMRMRAKIAGGAQMFQVVGNNPMAQIGQRNTEAVKKALLALRIPILAEDTGLNYGRTVTFDPSNGVMEVKSLNKQIKLL